MKPKVTALEVFFTPSSKPLRTLRSEVRVFPMRLWSYLLIYKTCLQPNKNVHEQLLIS